METSPNLNPEKVGYPTLWLFNIAMGNGPFIEVYLLKMVIFHGKLLNNQMAIGSHQSSQVHLPRPAQALRVAFLSPDSAHPSWSLVEGQASGVQGFATMMMMMMMMMMIMKMNRLQL